MSISYLNKSPKSAFTLVELLVVIAIIGILATLAIVSIQNTRSKARDTKRIADIKQIQTALELYFNDNGSYPVSSSVTSSIRSASRVYMEMYPQAPNPPDGDCTESNNQYVYTETGEDNGSYTLFFCLGGTNSGISSGLAVASPVGVEYGSFENLRVGLIGHWALDNIDGAVDKSTSGNDGTGVGGVTIGGATDRHGQAGGATTFDGSNDYIATALINFERNESFSFSAWVNKNNINTDGIILGNESGDTNTYRGYQFSINSSGKILFVLRSQNSTLNRLAVNSDNAITAGEWIYVTATYDGSSSTNGVKLYKNGVLQAQTVITNNLTGTTISTEVTKIGGRIVALTPFYFGGKIEDVRIYNRALSEEEVQQLYSLEN
ncbi:MAG: LamG-like jellyroll fold domain-containing protein [Patescibacteria group bacterium]|jgi:prepilin-type N-terminal cleavage/methylation domain-containing protein